MSSDPIKWAAEQLFGQLDTPYVVCRLLVIDCVGSLRTIHMATRASGHFTYAQEFAAALGCVLVDVEVLRDEECGGK